MTADDPCFSVIVPTFGRPALLPEALASVAAQTFGDFECIVVDDGSNERPVLPGDARFRLVARVDNGGPAAARNTGMHEARGVNIAFLDDDDVWVPDRLVMARRGLERAPVAVCWSGSLNGHSTPGRRLEGDVSDVILDGLTPNLGATAIRRDVAPPFDESYLASMDVEWWLRVAQSLPIATVPEVGHLYRFHPGVRIKNSRRARVEAGTRLLAERREYFDQHRTAAAFRWKRIGLTSAKTGDVGLAMRAYLRSFALRPSLRTMTHFVRIPIWARQARSPKTRATP